MKTLSTNPRVLLCTCFRRFPGDYFDMASDEGYRRPKLSARRRVSPALRFIKQNVPEVEILEFPLWYEYVAKLNEGWDVVGFSFYQNEINEIERMADEARRHNVSEIWAGNYGALDYRIPSIVDRIFLGPAEDEIAQVFGYRVHCDEIEHPPMFFHATLIPGNIRHLPFGLIYTQHGCHFKCKFCQTQAFIENRLRVNFQSIERVLEYYKKTGVNYISVIDELFGSDPRFADRLTELFARYDFQWMAQVRVKTGLRYVNLWYERGLRMLSVGIESMSQRSLDAINKKLNIEEVNEYARRSGEMPGLFRLTSIIIGYENMTAEETTEDAIRLKRLGFDRVGVNIITPYPKTPLWDELDSKYGIFDRTYRHYNNRNLVWNHPYISPSQIQFLRKELINLLNKPFAMYGKAVTKVLLKGSRLNGKRSSLLNLFKNPITSMLTDDREQIFFPKLKQR